jgi:hypothetical protein
MSNLISSVRNLDITTEDGGIVLEQTDPAGSEFKFDRKRIIITALQVPQVVTALRKAAAKFNASATAAVVRTRKYEYTPRARRAAGLGEIKKASSPVAGGKESSEVNHGQK